MLTETVEGICREAARLLQVRVGGNYQTTALHDYAQREAESIWLSKNWRETLRTVTLTVKSGNDWLVLPRQYASIVDTYLPTGVTDTWLPLYSDADTASRKLQSILNAGTEQHWATGKHGASSAVFAGEQCVKQQPDTAEKLEIASSNAADKGMELLVIGEDANGNPQREVVETNGTDGTTKVATSGVYGRIDRISTGATKDRLGNLVVTGKDSLDEYAVIDPCNATSFYARYQLAAEATADTDLHTVCKLRFQRIQDEIEGIPIPGTGMVMVYGICAMAMLEKRQNEYAQDYMQLRARAMAEARSERRNPPMMKMVRC